MGDRGRLPAQVFALDGDEREVGGRLADRKDVQGVQAASLVPVPHLNQVLAVGRGGPGNHGVPCRREKLPLEAVVPWKLAPSLLGKLEVTNRFQLAFVLLPGLLGLFDFPLRNEEKRIARRAEPRGKDLDLEMLTLLGPEGVPVQVPGAVKAPAHLARS